MSARSDSGLPKGSSLVQVEDASAPQYWDRPKCERFLLASRSNKINVVVREEGLSML